MENNIIKTKEEKLHQLIYLINNSDINIDNEIFMFISVYRKLLINVETKEYFAHVNNDLLKLVEKFLLESDMTTIKKRISDVNHIYLKLNTSKKIEKIDLIDLIEYIFENLITDEVFNNVKIIESSTDEIYCGFEYVIENIFCLKIIITNNTVYFVSDLDNIKFPSRLFHYGKIIEPYINPVDIFHKKLTTWLLPKDYVECYKLIKNNYYEFHFTKNGIRVVCIKDDNNEYCYLYVDIIEIEVPLALRTLNYEIEVKNLDELYDYLDTQFKILVNFHINSKK